MMRKIEEVSERYDVGMFGGKFMPFHMGHLYCVERAAAVCDKLYLILFGGGDDELRIIRETAAIDKKYLDLDFRKEIVNEVSKQFENVIPAFIDVTALKLPDGSEDWDAETPLVIDVCGKLNAAFSSEPRYDDYFKRAYPWADHILVDPPRIVYPVSGTFLRTYGEQGDKRRFLRCNLPI